MKGLITKPPAECSHSQARGLSFSSSKGPSTSFLSPPPPARGAAFPLPPVLHAAQRKNKEAGLSPSVARVAGASFYGPADPAQVAYANPFHGGGGDQGAGHHQPDRGGRGNRPLRGARGGDRGDDDPFGGVHVNETEAMRAYEAREPSGEEEQAARRREAAAADAAAVDGFMSKVVFGVGVIVAVFAHFVYRDYAATRVRDTVRTRRETDLEKQWRTSGATLKL